MHVRGSVFSPISSLTERFERIYSVKMKLLFYFLNFTLVTASLKSVLDKHDDSIKMVRLGFCDSEGKPILVKITLKLFVSYYAALWSRFMWIYCPEEGV